MFRVFAVVLAVALAFASPAAARQDAVAERSSSESLARRYAELMELERMVVELTQAIGQGYLDQLVELGGAEGQDVGLMREVMNDTYAALGPRVVDQIVSVYVEVYTEEELAAMVAFYESPIGASIMTKTRQAEMMIAEQMMGFEGMFAEEFTRRYCARAECPKTTLSN